MLRGGKGKCEYFKPQKWANINSVVMVLPDKIERRWK